MLRQSFVHLPGVGPKKERAFWSKGLRDWDQFKLKAPEIYKDPTRQREIHEVLERSEQALERKDWHYFYKAFPREHLWRLVPGNFEDIAYLDIETTGMGYPPMCQSTAITFYFKGQVYQEHDHSKKRKLIQKILSECSLISTFYGEVFDVPFLRQEFGIEFNVAHLDLCFWLKRLGYKGGLKKVQKLFPDIPERLSLDIDGFDAVRLWRMHKKGVPGALETLLTYNAEDTVVLEPLLIKAFNFEVERHPEFGLRKLDMRDLPSMETRVHRAVYSMLRSQDEAHTHVQTDHRDSRYGG